MRDPRDKVPQGFSQGGLQQFDSKQMGIYNQEYGMLKGGSYLQRLAAGDESTYEALEKPAWAQLQAAQGQTASRFSGAGMGARRSSGFNIGMGQANSDFAMNLQAQRQQLRHQAIQELMGYSNQFLGHRPYEKFLTENPQGEGDTGTPWGAIGGGIVGAAGGALITKTPQGAMAGYQVGSSAGSALFDK